ncbi:MAG: ThiF family adenylyltransferase [Lachnospiraceae bacterium]|nr:ThiF family adenylyltransferase [Lachnospiraceae bacterium]
MDIKRPKNFFGEDIPLTVFISEEQLKGKKEGSLFGRYFEDTGIFNVFPEEIRERGNYLCDIQPAGSDPDPEGFSAIAEADGLRFFWKTEPVQAESYGLYQSIFSRNKGILETDVMNRKCAVILGCGSVGSLVAMELARSGVGHFVLCDADTLEYHNLCRHQCGIEDVGDLKVNALKRKLMNINPSVEVRTFGGIIQNINKEILDEVCRPGETIFVGCADNRTADVYSNKVAVYYGAAFLSIGFWERAYAGEIFYHIPNRGMPCYECALGDGGGMSGRVEANHHVYSNQENLEAVRFEPGISVDINFITSIGIKLIIDILNESNEDYTPRLLGHLKQYTLVCNTSDPKIGGEMVEIFSYPLQVTTSLVVGFGSGCDGKCRYEKETEAQAAE